MRKVKRARRLITPAERADMWRRWRAGASYTELAKLLKRSVQTVWEFFNPRPANGGFPRKPRRRSSRQLSESEREENFTRSRKEDVSSRHRTPLGTRSVDDLAGGCAERRKPQVQGWEVGASRGSTSASSQGMQTGSPLAIATPGRRQAASSMVSSADRCMAEAAASRGRNDAGLARNDLPQPVHPGSRRTEGGAT